MTRRELGPSVGVVVPTQSPAEELRGRAGCHPRAGLPGEVEVVVVFDGSEPDHSSRGRAAERRNTHSSGLPGHGTVGSSRSIPTLSRSATTTTSGCPESSTRRCTPLAAGSRFVTCSASSATTDRRSPARRHDRRNARDSCSLADVDAALLDLRDPGALLVQTIGLVDESIPRAQGEDWDLLLRAARLQPIVHVDRPLVRVFWGSSYFGTALGHQDCLSALDARTPSRPRCATAGRRPASTDSWRLPTRRGERPVSRFPGAEGRSCAHRASRGLSSLPPSLYISSPASVSSRGCTAGAAASEL